MMLNAKCVAHSAKTLWINESVEQGSYGHLGAITGPEFVHGIADVGLHRFHGHAEQIGD